MDPSFAYDDIDNNPFAEPGNDPVSTTTDTTDSTEQIDQDNTTGGLRTESDLHEQKQFDDKELSAEHAGDVLPERRNSKKFTIIVKVTGLERAGSPTNKKENPTIIFDISTNLPTFRKQVHKKVKKTLDEFRQFFKYLNGAIQEIFVPALPLSHTNYGINNREDYDAILHNFQLWFDRIIGNPLVIRNEELAFFIESDHNTYAPINKAILPATGLKRKTLKQLAPPYDETVDLAEFRPFVKSVHWASKDLQSKLLKVSRAKKILSQNENAFGKGFITLGEFSKKFSEGENLKGNQNKLYNHFGKIMTAVGDIDSIIATLDIATLYDGLEWIVNDSYVVKEALTNRHLIMRELLQAQQKTKSKQEQARKLRAKRDINPINVDDSLRQLKEATRIEQQLTLKLERVTANMILERKEWLEWYETCLKNAIKNYTLRKIEYERKKLSLLEKIRVDVRKADKNGGLARLGRDSLVKNINGNIGSQSVEGDNWTGDNRPHDKSIVEKLLHTEFDAAINSEEQIIDEQGDDSSLSKANSSSSVSSLLNAKSAVSLLGKCTF